MKLDLKEWISKVNIAITKVPVKPPDLTTLTKVESLTSGGYKQLVSTGAYYQARAVNGSTAQNCYVYFGIMDSGGNTDLFSCAETGASASYVRLSTQLVYIPQGVKMNVTAGFNNATASGIYKADPLQ